MFSDRAAQKVRAQVKGHEYAEQLLVGRGARRRRSGERPAAWLAEALDEAGARRVRHPGCHRYAFPIGTGRWARAAVRVALAPRPYPKAPEAVGST